jgi:hypothetical protein
MQREEMGRTSRDRSPAKCATMYHCLHFGALDRKNFHILYLCDFDSAGSRFRKLPMNRI